MNMKQAAVALAIFALVPLAASGYPDADSPPALIGLDPEKPMILPV